jgi:hypothetical protein
MEAIMNKHECAPENAAKMLDWIHTRGGVAIWESINPSNPGASWSTPATFADGSVATKPDWQCNNQPARIITDASDIEVVERREVKRFRVGVRIGAQGMTAKVTDGGTRKIHAAVEKAGEGASYGFDYLTQEAIITVPGARVPLAEYVAAHASEARP